MAFWASPSYSRVKNLRICLEIPLQYLDPVFQHRNRLYHQCHPIGNNETTDGSRMLTAFPSPTPFGLG